MSRVKPTSRSKLSNKSPSQLNSGYYSEEFDEDVNDLDFSSDFESDFDEHDYNKADSDWKEYLKTDEYKSKEARKKLKSKHRRGLAELDFY